MNEEKKDICLIILLIIILKLISYIGIVFGLGWILIEVISWLVIVSILLLVLRENISRIKQEKKLELLTSDQILTIICILIIVIVVVVVLFVLYN